MLLAWLTYGSQGGGAISGPVFMPGMNHAVGRAEGVSLLTALHLDFGYGRPFMGSLGELERTARIRPSMKARGSKTPAKGLPGSSVAKAEECTPFPPPQFQVHRLVNVYDSCSDKWVFNRQ